MDIDIKILPTVGFSLTERGEQLRVSLNLQTYSHKVNILGAHIHLISEDGEINIEKNITYLKRYIDPKSNLDLNLNILCCNSDSSDSVETLIYEFQNKIHVLSSKGIDKRNIGYKVKSRIYELKNEYLTKVLDILELPGKEYQLKLKVDYDPIKGMFDRFNRESFLIEKRFKLPEKEKLRLPLDNFLMQEVSKILLYPERVIFNINELPAILI